MNDVVIHARNLKKVYRLYAGPGYRFLDMFGMLGKRPGAYTEHSALDGIDLDIRRGEKVAIIGRNGAGKSTFLKLVTNVIQPTSGELEVKGKAHALLQIGSGFHPDFTGRENVYAYLAQLGVAGSEAKRRCAEVIEFAELEEYIDQPVKTYSTGMAVRLMFSTSTAISPDLLVLDEVLGVGDAYFANKSYDRIRELCDRDGTTLMLVTHDIYSAIKICNRVIWIDRGRGFSEDEWAKIVKAFEDSIRRQEEEALRVRKVQRLESVPAPGAVKASQHVIIELHARENQPQPCAVYISRVELLVGNDVYALPLGDDAFGESRPGHLQREPGCWGPVVDWEGRQARPFLNYGSPFHKVAGALALPGSVSDLMVGGFSVRLNYWSEVPCDVLLRTFLGAKPFGVETLPPSRKAWVSYTAAFEGSADARRRIVAEVINATGVNGTGVITVDDVSVAGPDGVSTHFLKHGEPATFSIRFRVVDRSLRERAQVVIAIHRDGALPVCRYVARELMFDGRRAPEGVVRLSLDRMVLGIGSYLVSVMIAAEGYLDKEQLVFYSLNSSVYASHSRVMEFSVTGEGLTPTNIVFVGDGNWSIAPQVTGVMPQ
jgi:ABC-type polysaccharide/polyol phosphate transport system ATPase subunit